MDFPSWIPQPVRPLLERLNTNPASGGRRRPVFDRLLEDRRMETVYREFLRRDRKTGDFLHAARNQNANQPEEAQIAALREVLIVAISAATDQMSVSKVEQIEETKRRYADFAAKLRGLALDMALASELGLLGLDDPAAPNLSTHDCAALLRVANWLEHLNSAMRRPTDLLVVDRHRGDPVVRGVQIMIGHTIEEQFGERLDGTAATLTSVALGVVASPRASRSALAEENPRKRRSAI